MVVAGAFLSVFGGSTTNQATPLSPSIRYKTPTCRSDSHSFTRREMDPDVRNAKLGQHAKAMDSSKWVD